MAWYTVQIQRAQVVGDVGIQSLWNSVFLIRALDRQDAHERALALGKSLDHEYSNASGESIRLALVGVVTIDRLGDEIQDGTEVYFEPNDLESPISVELMTEFHFGRVEPKMTGVGVDEPSTTEGV